MLVAATGTVAALAAYIVLAAPTTRPVIAAPPTAGAPAAQPLVHALATGLPPVVIPPVVRRPTLGISAATTTDLDRFIAVTGTHPEVFDVFEDWSLGRPLQRDIADTVAARGARLSITWEPWDSTLDTAKQPDYSLASIVAGDHDDYIDVFASSIRAYPHPVTIRLMHEMNGNWYPWGSGVNGNQDGEYVRAWQHVHGRFTALGVTNVDWMWAPNAVYAGAAPLAPLYPGDTYVDAVGVSNYNWGERTHDGFATRWRTFDSLFEDSFAALQAITSRPLWVAEVGSSNAGGSKADWLVALLAELRGRPEIAGLVWFDHVDERHDADWRIETEAAATQAWRTGFASRRSLTEQRTTQ